jgi:hypothetical protein
MKILQPENKISKIKVGCVTLVSNIEITGKKNNIKLLPDSLF